MIGSASDDGNTSTEKQSRNESLSHAMRLPRLAAWGVQVIAPGSNVPF